MKVEVPKEDEHDQEIQYRTVGGERRTSIRLDIGLSHVHLFVSPVSFVTSIFLTGRLSRHECCRFVECRVPLREIWPGV